MAKNNRYTLQFRRRREGKTDYHQRYALLKGRTPRLVVRKSNNHTVVQVVSYDPDGDVIKAHASTEHLSAYGWSHATSNVPAAYLAGYLAAVRAADAGVSEAVLDLGMQEPHSGGRIFAAVRGAIDGGLDVPAGEQALPGDERVMGAHIDESLSDDVEATKQEIGK